MGPHSHIGSQGASPARTLQVTLVPTNRAKALFSELAGPHKARMTLIALCAFMSGVENYCKHPEGTEALGNLQNRTNQTTPPEDPAPRDNIKTSCSPTETPCSTTPHYPIEAQSPNPSGLVLFSAPSPFPPLGK